MSTRACYSFKDPAGNDYNGSGQTYHVYKHSDGYPTGAAQWLQRAKSLAWKLPRYEADEFAAAFVAANKLPYWCTETVLEGIQKTRTVKRPKKKDQYNNPAKVKIELVNPFPEFDAGGGIRLMKSGDIHDVAPGDIEYRYEVYQGNEKELRVKAYQTNYWNEIEEEIIFDCNLDDMPKVAEEYEDSLK